MPSHKWFQHIDLGSHKRRRRDSIRKCNAMGRDITTIKESLPTSTPYKLSKLHGKRYRYMNYITTLHRLKDIASLYGLSQKTVVTWYYRGMLPEAFYYTTTKYRTWGNERMPLYTREQLKVICMVLDDIFSQGVKQFRKSYLSHIKMMYGGNKIVMERIEYKIAADKPNKDLYKVKICKPKSKPLLIVPQHALRELIKNTAKLSKQRHNVKNVIPASIDKI